MSWIEETQDKFLKKRVSSPEINRWSAGFSAVSAFAESNGLPFIAFWGNYHCSECAKVCDAFEKNTATDWIAEHKCAYWYGEGGKDVNKSEDGYNGTGYKWLEKEIKNKYGGTTKISYPLTAIRWKDGAGNYHIEAWWAGRIMTRPTKETPGGYATGEGGA